ncbi:MAG: M48 family metallopeptidase [Trueperaceae bacterium]|nr:M48 family metallopeptidase [Trueperaceae bacterium]MCO5174867.1 M48 family metallopeptidase [Trueperaceae bacterium]MCW5818581.1 M48 family metallopeptidase [Trueperaceae bacterium]
MSDQVRQLGEQFTVPGTGRKINLLDYQAANKRSTWLLALFTVLLLAAAAYLLAQAVDPGSALFFIGVAGALGFGQAAVGFWFSDQIALAASGARVATVDEHRYLVNVAEAVAIGAGVPMPKVYVIDSPAPNAFATGRDPQHASIAVTSGLLQLLDRQELEGVVAHELAHVRNYDIRFMSMLVATLGALLVLRDMVLRWGMYGGLGGGRGSSRRDSRGGGNGMGQGIALILLVVLLVIGPIVGTLVRLAVSRGREYLADATGAYITRNPEGLAMALEKLAGYSGQRLEVSEGVRHMFFVNPAMHMGGGGEAGIFSTHPPIAERIRRLRNM